MEIRPVSTRGIDPTRQLLTTAESMPEVPSTPKSFNRKINASTRPTREASKTEHLARLILQRAGG